MIGPVPLLAPVSLTVETAECALIRGVNGSGKTTLLRILVGLIEPTTGTANIDGEPVDERNAATRAGELVPGKHT